MEAQIDSRCSRKTVEETRNVAKAQTVCRFKLKTVAKAQTGTDFWFIT